MTAIAKRIEINIVDVNIEIQAIDRLCRLYFNTIEKWEPLLSSDSEELAWIQERYDTLNARVCELLELKSSMNLPL